MHYSRLEYAKNLRSLIDGTYDDELGEVLTPIAEYLEQETLEDVIAWYQQRAYGEATVTEGIELSAKFSDACRKGQPIPAWALVIRALTSRIALLKAVAKEGA